MRFGNEITTFFNALAPPKKLPQGVDVLWPYDNPEVKKAMDSFFTTYFSDANKRIFLIGINPGRFGAGVTGISFTDTLRLAEDCGIPHQIKRSREISSDFVYRVISAYGGPRSFYQRFYITALSPVGYVRDGKNMNYYDIPSFAKSLDAWMAEAMAAQINAGCDRRLAFSMGQGANYKYLTAFNSRHNFFDRVMPLPHPRWVMQYRRKRLDEFVQNYVDTLQSAEN